ncbi:acyl-CoA thioesterase [Alteribacillus iranensis]|uniref:Acyl-CoA thioester hydrolase n=1 Tax=Alteribacillus iranensis TaxID=930128 RepID=A0A1I2A089_9BACI|nr:thioesterase family protein [Alteribacillus iranensis]SFE37038.1 acyl-CoA thioester hydrolase [Alteribacillus iranensis]
MLITETDIEVRYAETDQMGVVHHSNYIIWCELGRTNLIKKLGFDYSDLEKEGILSPVININLDYKAPAHYGETVRLLTWIDHYDGLRVVYGYEIRNEDNKLCATGKSSHVCVRKDSFRPISIKKHLPIWHDEYEKHKKKD